MSETNVVKGICYTNKQKILGIQKHQICCLSVGLSLKAMHGTLKSIEGPPNLGITRPLNTKPTKPLSVSPNNRAGPGLNGMDSSDKKPPSSSSPIKKPLGPGWKCTQCERLFPQREVFVAHMRREHGKVSSEDLNS